MNTILTDDEIDRLPLSAVTVADGRADARAIEAAVLAKLREQEPIGWVLVNKDGELVGWHDTVHTFDPSEGGFSNHPAIADANDPDGEPHRWVQVVALAAPLPAVVPPGYKLAPLPRPFMPGEAGQMVYLTTDQMGEPSAPEAPAQAGRVAELERQLKAYEAHGVTCQTFRHFVDTPCAECNVRSPEAPAQGIAADDLHAEAIAEGFESVADYVAYLKKSKDTYFAERNSARDAARRNREAPALPADVREAIKVARETWAELLEAERAFKAAEGGPWVRKNVPREVQARLHNAWQAHHIAIARLDALGGGE